LTTKVKTRMLENREFAPNHVKVISERGEVFLLGLVTPTEGNTAARIASETAGVLKVHTLFEYLDPKTGMVSP
ncbi:MAG: BON domain-containing protein, partial [Aquaspirillum sp.]